MPLTKEEIKEIAIKTADELVSRLRQEQEDLELRDLIIGSTVGEGAIPLHGRELRKAPCHGCRMDPSKPLEAGNVMATTEGAIGTLSSREVREWCSEIIETPDGRCHRVRSIREAAKKCKELYPTDTAKFFECYAPAWAAITKGEKVVSHSSPEVHKLRQQGDWVYAKVGDTEMRGKKHAHGIDFEQVSPTYNQGDLDKAVKIIEEFFGAKRNR